MKRVLLNAVVILSTVWLLTLLVVWPVSHSYQLHTLSSSSEFVCQRGRVAVIHRTQWEYEHTPSVHFETISEYPTFDRPFTILMLGEQKRTFLGVEHYKIRDLNELLSSTSAPAGTPPTYTGWAVSVPLWQPALLSALLPMLWFFRWRKSSKPYRRKRGLCVKCGYDLRGSASESAACPECGATP